MELIMKKFLLLVTALVFISASAWSETLKLNNVPLQIGATTNEVNFQDLQSKSVKFEVPYANFKKNNLNKILFRDLLENEFTAYSTRLHPFPEDPNEIDSARIIYDRNNPNDQNSYFYVGDTRMPVGVTDQTGNIAYRLNGYLQAMPSLSYYYPQLYNGTFTIDSINFFFYSYPDSPIKNGFIFSMLNIKHLNLTNFGADNFNPNSFEFEYYNNIYDKLEGAYILDASYINSRVQQQGGGYIINATSVKFDNPDLEPVREYKEKDPMLIILAKDDLNDLSDTVSMIGAWEWTIPATHAFAGCIRHHGVGVDSVSLLSGTIAPLKPAQSSPYYAEWVQKYPYYMQETVHKKNYRFVVYGRYTGEYNPNSVKEINNSAEEFKLYANSPNPVLNTTQIKFDLQSSGFVTLKVYNQLGEEVAVLVNEFMNPGQYESTFEVNSLPAGAYYYSLSTSKYSKTLPMIIVK